MEKIANVGGTAFVVAEFRAEENIETAPLYQDRVVELFLNEDTRRAAARVAASFPPVKDLVKIRTKYLDDMLATQLRSYCRQVVILGAGLDTRAVRQQSPGVRYFEIDEAATLAVKRARYEERGFDVNLTFIPGNYVTESLIQLLEQNDFDFDLPTYFIWEGNTMYLPLDGTTQILTELRRSVPRFRVSFDYMAESVISKTTGDAGVTRLVESFANMGAPWLSGIRDVRSLAQDLGLDLIEDFVRPRFTARYWPGRPILSPIFNYYSVCTLGREATH